ncbi:TetR/AcrR family transcriptional regulator [Mycolicibacterium setense]|uniref:TetR/AcrR family transcriptional regulator n=1 Tax=Mycolicibacterium setense TaxID=431269 RepID=UPI0005733B73|nr:TetR/AcrR family transcriptional regulator [Mycolicibacterium setense]KHO18955.1 hypothetical protein QQ25_19220 [Mycolicibacterium setense]MCV7112803.1 TetR/AcrR family transcriptional regulator [Mycolicibacterium setense]
MKKPVKRDYQSQLRADQARDTRRSIVDAASQLFIENGYGATTIDAVAQLAGVSRKTVFTVGGKVELLKTALDWAIAGDDRPVALADRPTLRQLLDQDDPRVLIAGWAQIQVDIDQRAARLFRALEVAAETDEEAGKLLAQVHHQRLMGAQEIVRRLDTLSSLTKEVSEADAADLAWLATDPMLFDRLVLVRGWTLDRFHAWLVNNLLGPLISD